MSPNLAVVRIIAWGNRSRRDDGVALALAERLGVRFAFEPAVVIERYPQLGPELAMDLETCEVAIFVDAASPTAQTEPFRAEMISGGPRPTPIDHAWSPTAVLGLAQSLGLRIPAVWQVSIRAEDFRYGHTLSQETTMSMVDAEMWILLQVKRALGAHHRRRVRRMSQPELSDCREDRSEQRSA